MLTTSSGPMAVVLFIKVGLQIPTFTGQMRKIRRGELTNPARLTTSRVQPRESRTEVKFHFLTAPRLQTTVHIPNEVQCRLHGFDG